MALLPYSPSGGAGGGGLPLSGDIKEACRTSDHDGWVLLNGRAVSSLTVTQRAVCAALGIAGSLPDARNRFSVGAGNLYGVNSTGGSTTIARSALPNVALSFNVTSGAESRGHTHTIDPPATTTSVESQGHTHSASPPQGSTSSYSHSHNILANGGWDGDGNVGLSDRGSSSWYGSRLSSDTHGHTVSIPPFTTGGISQNHTHNVDIPAFTSGNISVNHTHNVNGNTQSLNGGVTQTAHLPPYIAFGKFIYLGL